MVSCIHVNKSVLTIRMEKRERREQDEEGRTGEEQEDGGDNGGVEGECIRR